LASHVHKQLIEPSRLKPLFFLNSSEKLELRRKPKIEIQEKKQSFTVIMEDCWMRTEIRKMMYLEEEKETEEPASMAARNSELNSNSLKISKIQLFEDSYRLAVSRSDNEIRSIMKLKQGRKISVCANL
jgi:hypothetical protein